MQIRNSRELENDIGSVVRPPPDAETCLTLLYGLYVVVSPLITMCYVKETWKKIKTWFRCKKYNFIHDGNSGNRNLANSDCTLKTLKTYENIVKIVPLSAGIHQIRPGHDEPEYADVPISGNSNHSRSYRHGEERQDNDLENLHSRPFVDGGTTAGTSDYGSDGSATVDEMLHRGNDTMKTQNVCPPMDRIWMTNNTQMNNKAGVMKWLNPLTANEKSSSFPFDVTLHLGMDRVLTIVQHQEACSGKRARAVVHVTVSAFS
uniref:Uncharacterized protein n=1 Tax=Romanomermis culicivorax TaxID=13658 RepID=A0A915ITF4_ROMCU